MLQPQHCSLQCSKSSSRAQSFLLAQHFLHPPLFNTKHLRTKPSEPASVGSLVPASPLGADALRSRKTIMHLQ